MRPPSTGRERQGFAGALDRLWYGTTPLVLPLVPFSWLFAAAVAARARLYGSGMLRSVDIGKPVIVVGNIVSGGAGKTPLTLWLAATLKERGLRPGIVSRGYRGTVGPEPVEVMPEASAAVVGDEPLLMARRLVCPVVVHPDRVRAARMLVEMGCDVVVADDGLQHYRLARRWEVAVVDARRGFGNGRLLPAGPLREPVSRLASVDRIMVQRLGSTDATLGEVLPEGVPSSAFQLQPDAAREVRGRRSNDLEHWRGRKVHAVAGIADPERFFRLLESHGIEVIPHPFPDHAPLSVADVDFADGIDVLMTEKDAVRFSGRAPDGCWYVPVNLQHSDEDASRWLEELVGNISGGDPS